MEKSVSKNSNEKHNGKVIISDVLFNQGLIFLYTYITVFLDLFVCTKTIITSNIFLICIFLYVTRRTRRAGVYWKFYSDIQQIMYIFSYK